MRIWVPFFRLGLVCALGCIPCLPTSQAQVAMVEHGTAPRPSTITFTPLPQPRAHEAFFRTSNSSQLQQVYDEFARVLMYFTSRSVAPPDGVEVPNLYELPFADYLTGSIRDRCRGTIQGATNTRYLSGPYFYNEQNGSFGVRCNVLPGSPSDSSLAIQFSPASGSIALIRYHSFFIEDEMNVEQLPTRVLMGFNAGIEAVHRFHRGVSAGLRLYARGEVAMFDDRRAGVATYEMAYLNLDLAALLQGRAYVPMTITLLGQAFDRGDARQDIYDFEERTLRGVQDVRTGFEGLLLLTFHL
jgi:hypothetical protein